MKITTQIITKNNEKTIESTLKSLKLDTKIIVVDLGSNDRTIEICKNYNCRVYNEEIGDFSKIRNNICQNSDTDWQFYINPWEIILQGFITEQNVDSCRFLVMNNGLITKETRLWKKSSGIKFINPIFETLSSDGLLVDVVIDTLLHEPIIINDINEWIKNDPTSNKPYYYLCCDYLKKHDWDNFIRLAEHYLFLNKSVDDTVIMIKYYMSIVYKIKKFFSKAISCIIDCIKEKPLMAEFWCVLADIYFKLSDFGRAKSFYENAKIMGEKRDTKDSLPIEISKYEEYPDKMLKIIEKINI